MTTIAQISPLEQATRYAAIQAMSRYDDPADTTRITKAVELVLGGHVTINADRTATVTSQTGQGTYHCNGTCTCPDFPKAKDGRCKHRFAAAMLKKAQTWVATGHFAVATDVQGSQVNGWAFEKSGKWVFMKDGLLSGWYVTLADVVLLAPLSAPIANEPVGV